MSQLAHETQSLLRRTPDRLLGTHAPTSGDSSMEVAATCPMLYPCSRPWKHMIVNVRFGKGGMQVEVESSHSLVYLAAVSI